MISLRYGDLDDAERRLASVLREHCETKITTAAKLASQRLREVRGDVASSAGAAAWFDPDHGPDWKWENHDAGDHAVDPE